jgi:hypothetical protein
MTGAPLYLHHARRNPPFFLSDDGVDLGDGLVELTIMVDHTMIVFG